MTLLSDQQYAEYVELLKAWVEADKALKRLAMPDAGDRERAAQAHAAVQGFRERYGLGGREEALEGSAREAR